MCTRKQEPVRAVDEAELDESRRHLRCAEDGKRGPPQYSTVAELLVKGAHRGAVLTHEAAGELFSLAARVINQTLHELLLAPTKTAESRRDLPVPVEYCRELTAYRKSQLTLRLARGEWPHPESIFTTETGDYLSPSTFSSRFSAVKKRYGIRSTFHMLRHDMASRMKASGMFDMKDIQEQPGHSTIQITMDIYTHLEEDEKNAVRSWVAGGLKDVL